MTTDENTSSKNDITSGTAVAAGDDGTAPSSCPAPSATPSANESVGGENRPDAHYDQSTLLTIPEDGVQRLEEATASPSKQVEEPVNQLQGQEQALRQKRDLSNEGNSKLSVISKKYDMGNKGYLDKTEQVRLPLSPRFALVVSATLDITNLLDDQNTARRDSIEVQSISATVHLSHF